MNAVITLTIIMISVLLLLPSKKKPPITKVDDKVIDFIGGKACLRDAR